MKKEFANVIVDISHEKVDRPFGYRIPERLADSVTPGVRVKIPFGAGNALRTGYVIEVTDHSEFPRERMKEIDSVLPGTKEPSQRLIVLAAWMKQQYGSTMIQALKNSFFVSIKAFRYFCFRSFSSLRICSSRSDCRMLAHSSHRQGERFAAHAWQSPFPHRWQVAAASKSG